MPKVNLQRALNVPAVPARVAASEILQKMAAGDRQSARLSPHLGLGDVGLPDVGYIVIPVRIAIASEELEPRHQIRFTMRAKRGPEGFPVFDGALGVDSSGPSSSEIWLGGTYEVPMRTLGAFFDKLIARNVAEKSLENLLSDLAEAIAARVEHREISLARDRLFDTGD
ncbi:MAG TPA: hypothetical protein VFO29_08230 [Candidatus Rubrimentiphilum sp.]|nr:hypothetical protein [Candidatus Rubrimentiphilum sp.]